MMLGARTAAWAKSGGWKNPYITDGLIAMWDGVWNEAGGEPQNRELNYLNDLSGLAGRATYSKDTIDRWDDYGPILHDKSYFTFDITDQMRDCNSSDWTLELIADFTPDGKNAQPFCFGSWIAELAGWRFETLPRTYFACGTTQHEGPNATSAQRVVFSRNASTYSFEINGSKVVATATGDTKTGLVGGIGYWIQTYGGYSGTSGTFKSGRFYNRFLSPQEIAENYAVDKVRFNLP